MVSFEKVFEDLDVVSEGMVGALDNVTGNMVDNDEVSNLLNEIKSEQGIAVGGQQGRHGRNSRRYSQ